MKEQEPETRGGWPTTTKPWLNAGLDKARRENVFEETLEKVNDIPFPRPVSGRPNTPGPSAPKVHPGVIASDRPGDAVEQQKHPARRPETDDSCDCTDDDDMAKDNQGRATEPALTDRSLNPRERRATR